MDSKRFNEILEKRMSAIRETLASKAREYAVGDRLYNFKRAAAILQTTPERALCGMWSKHLVSVLDLIEGSVPVNTYLINEKIGDAINYLILLEAVLLEKMEVVENGTD